MKYFYGIYVKNTSELLYLVKTLQICIFFPVKIQIFFTVYNVVNTLTIMKMIKVCYVFQEVLKLHGILYRLKLIVLKLCVFFFIVAMNGISTDREGV